MFDFFTKLKEVFVKSVPDTSETKTLNSTDFAKLVRDALMVGGAAIITFFSEHLTSVNFGELINKYISVLTVDQWNMICVPILAGLMNTALKFFKGNK